MDRRSFLKAGTVAGVTLTLPPAATTAAAAAPAILRGRDDRTARLGLIGIGMRGREHLRLALQRDDCRIAALCDVDADALAHAATLIQKAGHDPVPTYGDDPWAWQQMLERDDMDGVIIATPWLWHTPMAVAAMRAGKYVGTEVPGGNTVEECWDLVNTSEATGMPCMMLENVCYRRDVMAVLNMVRQGLFGEMIHLEGGYQHDLRHVKFNDGVNPYGGGVKFGPEGYSEARWRTLHSVHRNGDLYPTHGIGPVAQCIGANRGNRFVYLTSTASKARGLHNYIVDQAGADHPNAGVEFKLGDVITTVLKTQNGETVVLYHDTNLPRPYSLGFRVQGTRGLWMDVNQSLYLEGRSPEHQWEAAAPYLAEYDHPLWRRHADRATGAGHGGMDFFVLHAFVEAIKERGPTPLDVYDAAAWSAIVPLSEQSIAAGSAPVPFPDFTRGQWMKRRPVFALDDTY